MACDHTTITHTKKTDANVLVHCNGEVLMKGYAGGVTSTMHEVEIRTTPQALVNRGRALGLTYSPAQMIEAMEKGATFPQNEMNDLHGAVWAMDMAFGQRMKALGHGKP